MRAKQILQRSALLFAVAGASGCGDPYAAKQAYIDTAYEQGQISLAVHERMTHQIEQERQQHQKQSHPGTAIYAQEELKIQTEPVSELGPFFRLDQLGLEPENGPLDEITSVLRGRK